MRPRSAARKSYSGRAVRGDQSMSLKMRFSSRAGELVNEEELQFDGAAVAVAVAERGDAAADDGVDAELFVELAGERLLGGLAVFDLAAGELPFEAHGLVGLALADEDLVRPKAVAICGRGRAHNQGGDHQPDRPLHRIVASRTQFAYRLFHPAAPLDAKGT